MEQAKVCIICKTERLSDIKKIPREGMVGKLVNAATYDCDIVSWAILQVSL